MCATTQQYLLLCISLSLGARGLNLLHLELSLCVWGFSFSVRGQPKSGICDQCLIHSPDTSFCMMSNKLLYFHGYLPPAYVVRGKVMFWHASVHPSICLSTGGGVPISHNALQHFPECHEAGGYPGTPPGGVPDPGTPRGGVPGSGTPLGGVPRSGTPPGGVPGSGTPRGGTRVRYPPGGTWVRYPPRGGGGGCTRVRYPPGGGVPG